MVLQQELRVRFWTQIKAQHEESQGKLLKQLKLNLYWIKSYHYRRNTNSKEKKKTILLQYLKIDEFQELDELILWFMIHMLKWHNVPPMYSIMHSAVLWAVFLISVESSTTIRPS